MASVIIEKWLSYSYILIVAVPKLCSWSVIHGSKFCCLVAAWFSAPNTKFASSLQSLQSCQLVLIDNQSLFLNCNMSVVSIHVMSSLPWSFLFFDIRTWSEVVVIIQGKSEKFTRASNIQAFDSIIETGCTNNNFESYKEIITFADTTILHSN